MRFRQFTHRDKLYRAASVRVSSRFMTVQLNGLRLEFMCNNLRPVVSWVLERGPYAKVIEPRELVEQVSRELRDALSLYAE